MADTIVALATPLGRSGIGVIRLSGPESTNILAKLIGSHETSFPPRKAKLIQIYDPDTETLLDEAVSICFHSPNSFTGEDVVEISCHGSPVVLRRVLDLCLRYDARLAEAGEFTLRALSNGRLNLSQAEAIRDLIESRSITAARQSIRQLKGELSHELQPLKDDLLNVIVVLESSLEFVEDDLPQFQKDSIVGKLNIISDRIRSFADTFQAGRLLREGVRIALVGRPNVGKSSLFNTLLGYERAIVTDIAGTTRDQLHETLLINDIPVSLFDTAGLRDTDDTVESMGVERSRRAMVDSDLILVILDGSVELEEEDLRILKETSRFNRIILVNKSDLPSTIDTSKFERICSVSAKTGDGIEPLRQAISESFRISGDETDGFLISDARHHDLLGRAVSEINSSIELIEKNKSEEIVLIGLHNAMRFLGEITGETTTEDMLTRIFSTFCIGK